MSERTELIQEARRLRDERVEVTTDGIAHLIDRATGLIDRLADALEAAHEEIGIMREAGAEMDRALRVPASSP